MTIQIHPNVEAGAVSVVKAVYRSMSRARSTLKTLIGVAISMISGPRKKSTTNAPVCTADRQGC